MYLKIYKHSDLKSPLSAGERGFRGVRLIFEILKKLSLQGTKIR